jgi:hypothetical protein
MVLRRCPDIVAERSPSVHGDAWPRLTGLAGIPAATIRRFSGKLLGNAIHQIIELLE